MVRVLRKIMKIWRNKSCHTTDAIFTMQKTRPCITKKHREKHRPSSAKKEHLTALCINSSNFTRSLSGRLNCANNDPNGIVRVVVPISPDLLHSYYKSCYVGLSTQVNSSESCNTIFVLHKTPSQFK